MINRVFNISGIVVFVLGIFLLVHSISYKVYTDEDMYQSEYMKLNGGSDDSDKFYQLRNEYLTPKFELENYGFTFIILGLVIMTVSIIGLNRFKTPNKKVWIVIIGIIAALFTNTAYVGDLFLEMYRNSFPHWADSLGIPLMGVPFLILLSLVWVCANLIGIKKDFRTGVLIFPLRFDKQNIWYLIILIITIAFTLFVIIDGYFWQVLPGFLWIYFYLSIMIGIKQAKIDKQKFE